MKEKLKLALIRIIRAFMRVLWVFPLKPQAVFIAFNAGQYSCNPKYISMYLKKKYGGDINILWVFNQPEKFGFLKDEGIKLVKNNSFGFFYAMAVSSVVVTNTGLPSHLVFRKKQIVINTWHGSGAYKKCGIDTDIGSIAIKKLKMAARDTDWFLSGCRRFSEVMSHSIMLPIEKMLETGMPRNDILFSGDKDPAQQKSIQWDAARRVRERFSLAEDTHIVIYAPTFRGSTAGAENEELSLDIASCLSALGNRFGGEWAAFYRVHYFLSSSVPTAGSVINVSDYPDMQELLCAADVLITDYSSCMWDMSLTGKPCFIYATDIEEYRQDRDFYTPVAQWPFPLAQDNAELAEAISGFDEAKYAKDVKRHHSELGSFETGEASAKAGELVYSAIKNKRGDTQ